MFHSLCKPVERFTFYFLNPFWIIMTHWPSYVYVMCWILPLPLTWSCIDASTSAFKIQFMFLIEQSYFEYPSTYVQFYLIIFSCVKRIGAWSCSFIDYLYDCENSLLCFEHIIHQTNNLSFPISILVLKKCT